MMSSSETSALLQLMQRRRSIGLKSMSPDAVNVEDIKLMLEAAVWVPNHGMSEPWRFTVFSGEGRRALGEAFAEAYRLSTPDDKFDEKALVAQRDRVWQAPVWISIGMMPGDRYPEWEELMTMGAVVENMQLMATQLGLGSRLSSGTISTHPHVAHFVGLQPPAKLLAFLYVGRPAGAWPNGVRKPVSEKVAWRET
jgi:nitroreductase